METICRKLVNAMFLVEQKTEYTCSDQYEELIVLDANLDRILGQMHGAVDVLVYKKHKSKDNDSYFILVLPSNAIRFDPKQKNATLVRVSVFWAISIQMSNILHFYIPVTRGG